MQESSNPRAASGRLGWTIAWLASGIVFLGGMGWGYVPPGFIIWSIVAMPLALLTYRWLARNGYQVPHWVSIPVAACWALGCLIIYLTRPWTPDWAQNVLAAYVGLVVLLGCCLSYFAENLSNDDGAKGKDRTASA